MTRRLSIALLILTLLCPLFTMACPECRPDDEPAKRDQWFKEIRTKKHQFLAKELELTAQQKESFFAVYDRMEEELKAVNDRTRQLERDVYTKHDASDAEYDAAIEAVYNQRYHEWNIENKAKDDLAKILSKKQLLKLKRAEFKFTRALMKQHRKSQGSKKTSK